MARRTADSAAERDPVQARGAGIGSLVVRADDGRSESFVITKLDDSGISNLTKTKQDFLGRYLELLCKGLNVKEIKNIKKHCKKY